MKSGASSPSRGWSTPAVWVRSTNTRAPTACAAAVIHQVAAVAVPGRRRTDGDERDPVTQLPEELLVADQGARRSHLDDLDPRRRRAIQGKRLLRNSSAPTTTRPALIDAATALAASATESAAGAMLGVLSQTRLESAASQVT
jgi:hypothetical protein